MGEKFHLKTIQRDLAMSRIAEWKKIAQEYSDIFGYEVTEKTPSHFILKGRRRTLELFPVSGKIGIGKRIQSLTVDLFDYLQNFGF